MKDYVGKNVLITGGSSGIGLALAQKLSSLGANIRIIARREDQLYDAIEKIKSCNIKSEQNFGYISADLTDLDKVKNAVAKLYEERFFPDMLINSAGVAHPGEFIDLDSKIIKWMMDVNYFGSIYITKEILPKMIDNRSGTIVNISSISGFIGVYGYTAYSGSKYAIRGFTDVLRSELKPYGIHVAIVFPPDTDTPQLEYENKFKPNITKKIAGSAGALTAEQVADEIIVGITKKRYIILPGFESKIIYNLNNLLGNQVYRLMDILIKFYSKK